MTRRTGLGGGKRGRETGNAGADHQHVTMGIAAGIVVGVVLGRRDAETGGGADQRLVDVLPGLLRPHEGLVVEAGGEEGRQQVVDRADIEGERRPAVLRDHLHAVEDVLHRGAHVRLLAGGIALDADQGIRLLGAGRDDAARAVILEGTADEMDAVGEKRRGDRVAFERRVALAVEGETRSLCRGETACTGDTIGAAHFASDSVAS